MAGLISTPAMQALRAMAPAIEQGPQTMSVCPLKPAKPARPAEYAAAVAAARGNKPLPMDPTEPSPVDELDARWQLAVGMSVWQFGRFMKVDDIQPYVHRCQPMCSVHVAFGQDITLIGEDGSTSCLLAGGDEPVPVYCWVR